MNLKICVQVSLTLSLFDFQLTQLKLLLSNLLHLCALLGKCYPALLIVWATV